MGYKGNRVRLKDMIKQEKEIMSPFRWKINYIVIPIWLVSVVCALAVGTILMEIDEHKNLVPFLILVAFVLLSAIALLCTLPWTIKKETQIELERYAYLFNKPVPFKENEGVQIAEDGLLYTLTADGLKIEWEQEEGGQVFDDVKENVRFIDWRNAEVAFATQTYLRRVHLAVAVFPTEESSREQVFFLPMSETLYSAIKAYKLDERMGEGWAYLFYNPQDAFKQILQKGFIVKMRNKKTGKVFVDEKGNFIP